MAESASRSKLVKMLVSLDAKPIESHMRSGTPDVNYIGGWIEMKFMNEWPKGCDVNPVKLSHPLRKEQGIWIQRRVRAGGTALVCLHIGREWLFWDDGNIKDWLGKVTRPEMISRACLHFPKGLNAEVLLTWLRRHSRG